MDAPLDLYRASREELIALVLRQREQLAAQERRLAWQERELTQQRAVIAQLQERVGTVLARLEPPDGDDPPPHPTTMPGLKPASDTPRRQPAPAAPRKRRGQGYGRARMTPTAQQVHAYDHCPHCGTGLTGGTVRHRREVIEVAPAPAAVTEHVYLERRCPRCHGRWQPGPELDGMVHGQQRLGRGLRSLIACLREEWRLPIRSIQRYLASVHGLRLSVGGHRGRAAHGRRARRAGGGRDPGRHSRQSGAACR